MDPSASVEASLAPAPGAKAAKVCGILAIVFALTCLGFPIAIVLGIVALVQQGKAKRLAKARPEVYAPVSGTGLVTGIIGLVLSVLMIPVLGIASAIAIPAFLAQRERAMAAVVQANLNAAMLQAEHAVQDRQARAPNQTPSRDAVITALSTDPAILSLRNPFTRSAPAFQRGTAGPLGSVMVYADQAESGGVTTWSIQFRALVRQGGQDRMLEGSVITHTVEHVQGHTEDGWEVVQPPSEAAPPTETQPPVPEPPPQKN